MRIIVLGAGEVGYDVADMLSREHHDVVLIDKRGSALSKASEKLDVLVIEGNGTSTSVLREAGAPDADLVIAVTSSDEVNVIVCMVASRMGADVTIARVRSGQFRDGDAVLTPSDLGINHVIHPEESTADEIVRLIRRASASDVIEVGGENMRLVGIRLSDSSPTLYRSLEEISAAAPTLNFRVMGISRGVRTIIPRGNERLHINDQVFALVRADDFHELARVFGKADAKIQDVMVLGGSSIGERVAYALSKEKGIRVKLIEPDEERATRLASELEDVLVIHGQESDIDMLATEGITEMDAFIAVTDDEASNLVTCLIAKHLGVSKTVALLSTAGYLPISQRIGIDAAVNKKRAVSSEILRFLRGKHVLSLATVPGLDAEILEIEAGPGSIITRRMLKDVKIKDGILIGAFSRDGDSEVATGDTQVVAGDRVVVFSLPGLIDDVERLFK